MKNIYRTFRGERGQTVRQFSLPRLQFCLILKSMVQYPSRSLRISPFFPGIFLISIVLLMSGCSAPRGAMLYREGNPNSLVFTLPITSAQHATGQYYAVKRDRQGRIKQVWQYNTKRQVTARYEYTWEDTTLLSRKDHFYNSKQRLRSVVEWRLDHGRPVEKHESFFDTQGLYEKLVITYVNKNGMPSYEETIGSGRKLVQTTEYYYDPGKRLDKKEVTYFLPNGNKRDFWITLYTNFNKIRSEERYLPNGTLISFYRNTFDVLDNHLTHSEAFNEETAELVTKDFDPEGRQIREEHLTRNYVSKGWQTWDFNEKPDMVVERTFDGKGQLLKQEARSLVSTKPSLGDLKKLTPKSQP